MVVRSRDGKTMSYPVVETIHKDSICYVTEAPAQAPQQALQAAAAYAEKAIACLSGAGIFGYVLNEYVTFIKSSLDFWGCQ